MTKNSLGKVFSFNRLRYYFALKGDMEEEAATIENIKKGIDFKGANLWVLIFAIIIASIGLNTNSTAVIIGAMLISPLMGPIIGIGLAVGINDMQLLGRSFRSLWIATLFSILAATLYFLISPLNEVQPELLARTSPTIYDVLIALTGGAAGILATCTRGKGSVLIGVAIATALMPPLCTVGFGLATGRWLFALGAFYLYFINSVFISIATFAGVRLMKFHPLQFTNPATAKRVRQSIIAVVLLTICPAIYLTYGIVKETLYTKDATSFITHELDFPGTQVIEKKIDYRNRTLQVVLMGDKVAQPLVDNAESKLGNYNLTGSKVTLIQGGMSGEMNISSLRSMVLDDFYKNSEAKIEQQSRQIDSLQQKMLVYTRYALLDAELVNELKVLYPTVKSIAMGYSLQANVYTAQKDTVVLAYLQCERLPHAAEEEQMEAWLKARTGASNLKLLIEKAATVSTAIKEKKR